MNLKHFTVFVFTFIFSLAVAGLVEAAEFDPNYLISDAEITNYNSMGMKDIQRFLDKRDGALKDYVTVDKDGNTITAAETFYQAANDARINPKYLLVLVQKEMSLLDHKSPEPSRYDWATGYGCPDSGGCNPRWQGFFKQVNSAALQTRDYVDNPNQYYYKPGVTATVDGVAVTPKNAATAGLYSYTPHISGNQSFWNLWNKYFGKKWPDGTLLQTDDDTVTYYIENGKKRAITSKSVFLSRFDPKKVVTAAADDLSYYEDGPPIKYLNFSLLKNSQGQIFMLVGDQKREIENDGVFKRIGFAEDEVITVADAELDPYDNGPKITQYTLYPAGKLLQNGKTKEIYYVVNGKKKLIINKEIMDFNFAGAPLTKTTTDELDSYRTGNPVTLPDGELVKAKNKNTVYVISDGQKMPIFNSNIFVAMKYKWNNITTVSEETLDIHPLGQTITGDW